MHRIDNNIVSTDVKVITNPDASIYVSASAGSGKTKLLIDRMLTLILHHNGELNKILCITYTNAAVQEIRERILDKALEWLEMPKTDLISSLQELGIYPSPKIVEKALTIYRLILNPETSPQIQTLHGFCIQSLNKSSIFTNGYQILSDQEAREEFFHSAYKTFAKIKDSNIGELKASIQSLLQRYSELDLIDILYNLHKFYNKECQNNNEGGDRDIWIQTVEQLLNLPKQIEAKDKIIRQFLDELDCEELLEYIDFIPKKNDDICTFLTYVQNRKKQNEEINIIDPLIIYEALARIFFTTDDQPRKRKIFSRQIIDRYPKLEKIFDSIFLFLVQIKEKIARHEYAKIIDNFGKIARLIHIEYVHSKLIANKLEYDDMIVHTIAILNNKAFAQNLSYKLDWLIDHMLIDEAQDLSEIQWDLIKLLTEEFYSGETSRNLNRTLFIVGDFKQSIFGFQGACPKIFLDINNYFSQKFNDAGKIWQSIQLTTNFRSNSAIIQAVNKRFPDWPQHIAVKKSLGIYQEINFENIEQLADLLDEWLKNKRYIPGLDRGVEPQDIMILVRRHSVLSLDFAAKLVSLGLKIDYSAYNDDSSILLIDDLIAVLKFVLMPTDDLNLAGLLKSPLIQLSEDEIFELTYQRDRPLWYEISQRQSQYITESNGKEILKYLAAYNKLNGLLKAFNLCQGSIQFVAYVLQYFSQEIKLYYYNSSLILSNLYQSIANENNVISMNDIIRIIKKFRTEVKERNSKYSITSDVDSRIVFSTIHGAKGLEAPIVILLDAMQKYQDPYELILNYDFAPILNGKYKFAELNSIKEELKIAQNAEKDRLQYVGMTRARCELYIPIIVK